MEAELAALQAQSVCSGATGAALHAFARYLVENGSDAVFEQMVLQARAARAQGLAAGSAAQQDDVRRDDLSEGEGFEDEDMDSNPTPRAEQPGAVHPGGAPGTGGAATERQHNPFIPSPPGRAEHSASNDAQPTPP